MAVFLINICKFDGCGIKFDSLGELITHIEDMHIDYDPHVIEEKEQLQPSCLPLSYVLRFITDAARKEGPLLTTTGVDLKRKLVIKHHSYSMSLANRSTTPTGSEVDDEEIIISESENSNESWTTGEFSSEFIMRYGSRHSGSIGNAGSNEKPFACPVPGCKKRYKNVNGIKYHSKNGHKKEGKIRKGFKCSCGKSYKTSQGLKNHSMLAHNNISPEALNSGSSPVLLLSPATSPSRSSSSSLLSQSRSLSPPNAGAHYNNVNSQIQLSSKINNARNPPTKCVTNSVAHVTPSPIDNAAVTVVNETNAKFGLITLKAASTNLVGINVLNVPVASAVHTFSAAANKSNDLTKSDDILNGNNNFTARFASLTDLSELNSFAPAKLEQQKFNLERLTKGLEQQDNKQRNDSDKQMKAKLMREKQQSQRWQGSKEHEMKRKEEIGGKRKNRGKDCDHNKHKEEDYEDEEDYEEEDKEDDRGNDRYDDVLKGMLNGIQKNGGEEKDDDHQYPIVPNHF